MQSARYQSNCLWIVGYFRTLQWWWKLKVSFRLVSNHCRIALASTYSPRLKYVIFFSIRYCIQNNRFEFICEFDRKQIEPSQSALIIQINLSVTLTLLKISHCFASRVKFIVWIRNWFERHTHMFQSHNVRKCLSFWAFNFGAFVFSDMTTSFE